eukprot:5352459-Amphidinium_carterae.2
MARLRRNLHSRVYEEKQHMVVRFIEVIRGLRYPDNPPMQTMAWLLHPFSQMLVPMTLMSDSTPMLAR